MVTELLEEHENISRATALADAFTGEQKKSLERIEIMAAAFDHSIGSLSLSPENSFNPCVNSTVTDDIHDSSSNLHVDQNMDILLQAINIVEVNDRMDTNGDKAGDRTMELSRSTSVPNVFGKDCNIGVQTSRQRRETMNRFITRIQNQRRIIHSLRSQVKIQNRCYRLAFI